MRETGRGGVEDRLCKGVKTLGGMCIKVAPIMAGVPDRLVLLPGGRMFLVELKAKGRTLRPIQRVFHARAAKIGVEVVVLTGPDQVDAWLDEQLGGTLL